MNNTTPRKPLCLIPARGGSKRIPRKNIALLGDRPLLAWTISPALESNLFGAVYVSSEDEEILSVAQHYGAEPIHRVASLAEDNSTLLELCVEIVPSLAAVTKATDLYLLTPTSPFRTAQTMRRAWKEYLARGNDSLISVEPFDYPPQWALTLHDERLKPLFPELYETPRPHLEPALKHDGGHIIAKISRLMEERSFFCRNAHPFFVPQEERLDIDHPHDLERAKSILEHINQK
ncbi:MAG: acylneuraminate cytidylyltransferase family protein [Verrucomicrobiae bacterium]|nr:acylneuraminate cytidylyltransferase family protein [Verrucomicrobiae bacterium]